MLLLDNPNQCGISTSPIAYPAITAMIAKILGDTDWQNNPVSNLKDIKNLLWQGYGSKIHRLFDRVTE